MTDFNDVQQAKGSNTVLEQINKAEKPRYVPTGFLVNDRGVFKEDGDIFICSTLYIVALTRDEKGNNWGRLLVWRDADGRLHEFAMPSSMLAGDGTDYRRILLERGLTIGAGRKAQTELHNYITTASPEARAISVHMPGWNGGRYVSVDGTIYGTGIDRLVLQISGALPKIAKQGTLESWQQNVAYYAQGNSRLGLSICAALVGPLLSFGNETSGGIHFSGESSGGKTTALHVAGSVWGIPIRSWRTTDNAAEGWARFANDGFLAIDELSQVESKAADQMAYMLGNGQTKGRANRDGSAKDTIDFRLMFLSTGETGLAEKIGEDKRKAKAGQTVRMLELPADAGSGMRLFEELHGFPSADEFAKYLSRATRANQGHAAAVWLEKLTEIGVEKLHAIIPSLVKKWKDDNMPPGADGQVTRVANKFALLAVAGELAAALGILPWPDTEASNAVARCFDDWLHMRGGAGSHETHSGIKAILAFVEKHGSSRFEEIISSKSYNTVYDRAGFKRHIGDSEYEYYTTAETLQKEILGGAQNIKGIVRAAIEAGLIMPDSEGKSTRPINLPGLGKKRVYCITPSRYKEPAL